MSITKDFRYKVDVAWEGDRITSVTSPDKPELTVATPPEFKNGVPGVWSPEDLLVAVGRVVLRRDAGRGRRATRPAAARAARQRHGTSDQAGRRALRLRGDRAHGEGPDRRAGHRGDSQRTARYAERACLVSMALDVPVHVEVVVLPHLLTLEVVA